jgi:hypothetical protein
MGKSGRMIRPFLLAADGVAIFYTFNVYKVSTLPKGTWESKPEVMTRGGMEHFHGATDQKCHPNFSGEKGRLKVNSKQANDIWKPEELGFLQ